MIRTILVLIFMATFLILSLPWLGIEFFLNKINKPASDLRQLRIIQCVFKILSWISGIKLTVIGEENVPTNEPILYIGNHRSFFDTVITYARCPMLTAYISKKSMGLVPIFNMWMVRLHCLFLDRDDIRQGLQVILSAIDLIKSGISVTVFPEGTRNKENDTMLPFKEGTFKIAQKTRCPIVPMAITNSSAILEDHFPYIRSAHVILEYGKPIYIDELDKEDQKKLGAYCHAIVEEMYEKNKALV